MAQTRTMHPQISAFTLLLRYQRQIELTAEIAATLDTDGIETLMGSVVTQCGRPWQPAFFGTGES